MLGPWDFGLAGIIIGAVLISSIVWIARRDSTRRVRFGFFLEREREQSLPDMQNMPPEVRAWLARFFEQYPYPRDEES